MNRHLPQQQRGNALLEFALILPILIGTALYAGELYSVNRARAELEQSAHTLASILAAQTQLDSAALDKLFEQAASPQILGHYEAVISRVNLDTSMDWLPLTRGSEEGICTENSSSGYYTAALPEYREKESDEEIIPSMIVVQLCRKSSDLALSTGLLGDKTLEAVAISRLAAKQITLDQELTEEVGLEDSDRS